MITIGSSGSVVKKIQNALNNKTILPPGEKPLVVDGKFGPMTASRVKLYQIQNSLKATGVVDNPTGVKLGLMPSDLQPAPVVVASSSSINLPLSSSAMLSEPSFFEKNKKSIIIAAGGLGVVFILSLLLGNKKQPIAIKSNPGKKSKKGKKSSPNKISWGAFWKKFGEWGEDQEAPRKKKRKSHRRKSKSKKG